MSRCFPEIRLAGCYCFVLVWSGLVWFGFGLVVWFGYGLVVGRSVGWSVGWLVVGLLTDWMDVKLGGAVVGVCGYVESGGCLYELMCDNMDECKGECKCTDGVILIILVFNFNL